MEGKIKSLNTAGRLIIEAGEDHIAVPIEISPQGAEVGQKVTVQYDQGTIVAVDLIGVTGSEAENAPTELSNKEPMATDAVADWKKERETFLEEETPFDRRNRGAPHTRVPPLGP
ncbi:hypothetical protein B0H94_102276 [Salsuginibacillus halophilus]|uniref:Uncharacterized protein n=1 Tax=Salsuginibacillus halophilus TaxID=517424 RepID=A0A2P8HXP1_9BACI|nr:hypothetical protein [Salsuginibacillus halophilus]PSL50999.1 hypothetical protein B0H94_102276 [Salsuginibacillus halophilus]